MKIETYLNAMELAALVKHEFVNRLMSVNIDSVVYRTYARAHEKRYRQRNAFRDQIIKMFKEKDELLITAAEVAYQNDVVATGMERDVIGGDNYEYADKEDWIDSWMYGLKLWKEADNE